MKAKKYGIIFSLLVFIILSVYSVKVHAAEDAIPSIQIKVILNKDGSAIITEVWEVKGVSSGTEYYKALNNMEGRKVHSFSVRESGRLYTALDKWNTKLSREEKKGTSGILKKSDGYELCWGIGDYGDHTYSLQYTIDNLVQNYGEYAGFYHQFISKLSSAPKAIAISIQMEDEAFNQENARIWRYGFDGKVAIQSNGSLTVISNKALAGKDYVNVLCRFDQRLFPNAAVAKISFEELQNTANDKDINPLIVVLIIFGFIGGGIGLIGFFYSRFKLSDNTVVRLPSTKKININYSIPFGGNIPAIYAALKLLRQGISYNQLMGAYLILWQEANYISIDKRTKKSKMEESILFKSEHISATTIELLLFDLLMEEVDHDNILWSSDIIKNATNISQKLKLWEKEVNNEGIKELSRLGVVEENKGTIRFTSQGFDKTIMILGLKKYLSELTNQSEEVNNELWGDYLVIAAMFNMGEKVLKAFENIDKSYYNGFVNHYGCNAYSMFYFMSMTSHISNSTVMNAGGTGGSTFSSGGGGFSGGGGGGSR
ncbi:DUF2207 domain-containing protein [Lachnoclostridium phytofermentans]|uniref:DUF2207 domain-containing protein n=1 Tax=Lachnoclostridium phytofermentans (strain ATCC 700394 / DSM 18823 / ISDg) TaxID=357809 RepID=A9KPT0_LACP7|nr:DUF2207 domain-containing protein [Lachnoclostridium phytofermentans]ABX41829.1 hypothetical protein Cphy_1455 [Lachnoclostridium phytofermentans ISDg]